MYAILRSAICLCIAMLAAGCGSAGSGLPIGAAPSLREAASGDLLYILDPELGGIDVYSYTPPKYNFDGIINSAQYGYLCVDSAQDVFATGGNTVVKYKHGATSPFRILGGLPGTPQGCALDPTTQTLALPIGVTQSKQVVSFFKKSGGKHRNISLPSPYKVVRYCAYDGSGDLFVGAALLQPSAHFTLLELPKGGKQFVEIALDESFTGYVTGGMFWDGKYLDIADQAENVIYQFAINGHVGTTNAKIVLQHSYDIGGFFIEGNTLIVPARTKPSNPSYQAPGAVNFYNYPTGGKKTGTIRGVSYPGGVVVSLGKGGR